MMTKSLVSAFLIAMMVSGFALVGVVHFGTVKASTDIIGIIYSDTTWTKAKSPYEFTGNVLVNNSVTLTIEPGVNVNFQGYYIRIEGILIARGNLSNTINFNSGSVEFSSISASWNETSNSGCIIENAFFNSASININDAGPKINNSTIEEGEISIQGGSPIISNNTLSRSRIFASGFFHPLNALICDNIISSGGETGIYISGGSPTIERNFITNTTGYPTSGSGGIRVDYYGPDPIIRNNTIASNSVGINLVGGPQSPQIISNNIYNNHEYNLYLDNTPSDINATYNYWGTTDTAAISQSIYDFEDDFNLGKVTFVPFLTEPNPEAMPNLIPEFPDTKPPVISVISPENKTYTVNHVSLNFTVSEPTSRMAYSLDGQTNATITGNTTITELSEGSHNLTIYTTDTFGNTGTSETIYFSIKTFPTTWIVAAIAIIAAGGAALLVYFTRIKKTAGKAE